MSENRPTVGLQKEHGRAYGSSGHWVVRVNGILITSTRFGQYAQAKELANAIFNGLCVANASPRWSYHPELK
jgi:hypothetical protein